MTICSRVIFAENTYFHVRLLALYFVLLQPSSYPLVAMMLVLRLAYGSCQAGGDAL